MAKEKQNTNYLEGLNKEQIEAVTHKKGPLLIVAGAGTGKTTVITRRLAYLIEQKLAESHEILAVTFTDKAAEEMEERVDRLLPFGYLDLWVSTFHSFCQRILKEHGLDIGIPTNFKVIDQTAAWLLVRQNFEKFNLDYYRPLGNPTKFIHALIDHFARCKDQGIYPEDYLDYFRKTKKSFDNQKQKTEEIETELKRIEEIASAYQIYQQLLLENNVLDFGDLINYCLKLFKERPPILKKYQEQFKYILVDEFQDTNWAQYELVKLLAQPRNNLTVCADDDQCLPGNAIIETPQGKKLIKSFKPGDEVLCGVGKAHIGVSRVKRVFKRKKDAWLLTIKTKSGYKIQVTDNHKMFCYVPDRSDRKHHYVYLMYRKDLGWRIGVTNDLAVRLRLERSADFILALRAFQTDEEARYYETLWSLKYGIPTNCFKPRERLAIKGELLNKLYEDLDVENNVKKLALDLNIDLNYPHFYLNAVTRGKSRRIMINVNMCARRYRSKHFTRNKKREFMTSPWIRHTLTLETSDRTTISKLKKAGVKLQKTKKGQCFRMESDNLKEIGEIAEKLQKITGGTIKVKSFIGKKNYITKPAIVMPAKNLASGHYLPIKKGKEIIYDQIVEIKREKKKLTVYDLEIEKTHNFIANGVVVHNSIYRWRGASFNNVLRFKEDFPEAREVILVKNYRSTQDILDLAYKFIQLNNPNRLEYQLSQDQELLQEAERKGIDLRKFRKISKKLIAQREDKGIIEHLHFKTLDQEVRGVIDKIEELLKKDKEASFSDFSILVRSNEAANPFCKELERRGIPHQFLASKGLYSQPVILDIISYFKLLDNYHESSAVFRILNSPIFEIPHEEIVKITNFSRIRTQSLYETLKQLPLVEGISEKTAQKINFLLGLIKKHTELARTKNVGAIFIAFLNDSGYLSYLVKKNREKDIEYLNQFYKKIKQFEESQIETTLANFLDQLKMELESGELGALEFDIEQGPDMVKVMTIHSAKGLEFKYVFLVNLVDKRFPTIERRDPIEIPKDLIKEILPPGDVHLQEERRLFYVGMTRAKKGLFLTSADDYGGARKKKLSRFLYELEIEKNLTTSEEKIFSQPKTITTKIKKVISLPPYFSFTQLAAFQNCPLQYKFAHILKIPRPGNYRFSFGKTMHNTLHRFLKLIVANELQQPSLEKLFEIYDDCWIDEWYESKKQKEQYYQLGKNSLELFWEKFQKEKPKIKIINGTPGLELEFYLKIKNNTLKGQIDRIDELDDDQIEIIDYKTGKIKKALKREDKDQLLIYQLAAEEVLGIKPAKLTYYYLDEGKEVSFSPLPKEKEEFKEKLLEQIEKIKKSKFEPTPGHHCQFCDFKDICEFKKISD
jgi:DNA helicase-2/ATP-dependent DNA helicase PcrA